MTQLGPHLSPMEVAATVATEVVKSDAQIVADLRFLPVSTHNLIHANACERQILTCLKYLPAQPSELVLRRPIETTLVFAHCYHWLSQLGAVHQTSKIVR